MRIAAIDVGSNSIKLIVAEAMTDGSFVPLAREKDVVRLGRETLEKRHLDADATRRAIEAIARFRAIAASLGAERLIAVATASVREADNAAQFVAEVERQTGVHVEILSGIEEARLIGLAAMQCVPHARSFINIDIGGGSTEISSFKDSAPTQLFSVKIGAVRLTERFIQHDPPSEEEINALRDEIWRALERPRRERSDIIWDAATGTSGTILAIGEALHGESHQGARRGGLEIRLPDLERFNRQLSTMTLEQRREVADLSVQRAEIIVAGGLILEETMRAFGIQSLLTCEWALREGVILDRLREMVGRMPNVADARMAGVLGVAHRFGYEAEHAAAVARLAEAIFDQLASHGKLDRSLRPLLMAAALLHDVGYIVAHESHHKHSLYLIKHAELTGFSEEERNIIANVARYHRGALPKEKHPDYVALNVEARDAVWKLASILRLAEALDRNHDGRVRSIRLESTQGRATLVLECVADCRREAEEAMRRREMFEQAFGLSLDFRVESPSRNDPLSDGESV
ncbi:MAG: exopolyphosphatase [Pyrinomonas sp.]|uniref:Ppx/GppA phosphatase family protein n=1 Tax=Pyrinomonas sp. TaxID=2080306 RepID=UPI00332A47B9